MMNPPKGEPGLHAEYADALDEAALRTLAAFANTDGGTLCVGLRPCGKVLPVRDPDAAARELRRLADEAFAPSLSAFMRIEIVSTDEGATLRAEVSQHPQRPVALLIGSAPGSIWIRRRSRTVEAKPSIIAAMKSAPPQPWDSCASLNPNPEFASLNRLCLQKGLLGAETLRASRSFLTADGAWSRAAEVFSDQNASTLRCVRFGADPIVPEEDVTFSGNILTQYFDALAWLEARGCGSFGMSLVSEALINAVLHRDYAAADAAIRAELSPGKLEIISPGGLPAGMTEADALGGISRLRNPGIFAALKTLGLAQGLGGGLGRIAREMKSRGGSCSVKALPGGFRLVLTIGLKTDAAQQEAAAHPHTETARPAQAPREQLSKVEQRALDFLKANPGARRREVQEAVGLSQAGTVNLLRRLIERGHAVADGNGPSTRYRLR